jgi:hypothetical protein
MVPSMGYLRLKHAHAGFTDLHNARTDSDHKASTSVRLIVTGVCCALLVVLENRIEEANKAEVL